MRLVFSFLFLGLVSLQAGSVGEVNKKLETIIIPQIQLEDVSFPAAIEYLRQRATTLDPAKKKGFNVVMNVPKDHPGLQSRVTLTLNDVPVGVALDYVTQVAHLRYKVEAFAVVILPLEAAPQGQPKK